MGIQQVLSGDIIDSLYANIALNAANPTAGKNDILPTQLTGFVAGAGTVVATDTILQAIQKLAGSGSGYVPYTGATSDVNLGAFNLITPKVTGGSAVGSQLTLQGTSGVGTSTVAAIVGNVGNNGATNAFNVYNDGQFLVGTSTRIGSALAVFRVGVGTSTIDLGQSASGVGAFWMNTATPAAGNWVLQCDGSNVYFNTPVANGQWSVGFGNATNLIIGTNGALSFTPSVKTSGAVTNFTFTGSANTGQTASTEINRLLLTTSSRQWATGAITTQREVYITSPTYSFVGASTIAESYTMYLEAPTASTNATITNNFALGLTNSSYTIKIGQLTGTASQPAIYLNQATPSSTNYSLTADSATTVLNGATSLALNVAAVTRVNIAGVSASGSTTKLTVTQANTTNQTASTEVFGTLWATGTRQWATGAITTQREFWIQSPTYSFVGASTITNAYTLYVAAPTASTNATITNNWAAGFQGNTLSTTTTGTILNKTTTSDTAGGAFQHLTTNSLTLYSVSWGSTATLNTFGITRASNAFIYTDGGNQFSIGTTAVGTLFNIATGNVIRLTVGTLVSSGNASAFTYSPASNTGQTASTEINGFLYNSYTRTWAAGAITTQREQYIKTVTYAFASASTITTAYGMYIEAPTAGSNATITNNYALGLSGGSQHIVGTVGNAGIVIRAWTSVDSYGAIYMGVAPSTSNYSVLSNGSESYLNATVQTALKANGTSRFTVTANSASVTNTAFSFAPTSDTGQTASTEIPSLNYASGSRQWNTGAITTQRDIYFRTQTYTSVGASTITNAYGMYIEAPTASTNITITNNWALGLSGNLIIDSSTNLLQLGFSAGGDNLTMRSTAFAFNRNVNTGAIYNSNAFAYQWNRTGNTAYASDFLALQVYNTGGSSMTNTAIKIDGSGAVSLSPSSNTTRTASAEEPYFKLNSVSCSWSTGAITNQRFVYFASQTMNFGGASVITSAYGLYVEAPTAGVNATITRNWALGLSGNLAVSGSTFMGSLSTAPTAILHLAAGTASANTSPLKFTSGTLLATTEGGSIEYDGTHLYFTAVNAGTRYQLDQQASFPAYIAKTANYTATNIDTTIDCTANSFTVTLPTAVGITGKIYNVINSGAGTITLATTSSQVIGNISPTTTITINPGEVINVQSDGANWKFYA